MQESEGKTMRGSKALSETRIIKGLDAQRLYNGDEGMDEGKIEAMPSAPPPVGTLKKDDNQC